MLRLIVISICVTLSLSKSTSFDKNDLDEFWETFKSKHNKHYEENEESLRRMIWEKNVKYIERHNRKADFGEYQFRLGINEYTDMTPTEFKHTMNGLLMSNRTQGSTFLPASNVHEPNEVDWRTEGYVTEVKNQGQCGSCWAFSTTGSLEGQHFKKSGKLVSLSEQNLVDCSKTEGNLGCAGGLMDFAFEYIKKNDGIDTEESYPYEAQDGQCRFKSEDVGATCTGYTDIPYGDENALKNAVASIGPISVAIDASHGSFQMYKTGVYDEPDCSSSQLDHGVLVVGYGTYQGQDYWLVKNSWGESWGMAGYIMMSRGKDNQCGIASKASYPLV